jgi:Zn-dependent peptidase ImmA (M78 family)
MGNHQHNQSSFDTRDPSVLARLRALVPDRQLTFDEALRIAELQANHLLRYFEIETEAVPEEIISELPRVRVVRDGALAVSGSAHWNGRYWIITVNGDEPVFRQRFSVMHEFKHVVDHTTRHLIYHDRPGSTANDQAERVADYFAACVLMPRRVVKSLWCSGSQDVSGLARRMKVSPAALRYRLDAIGLTDKRSRCQPSRRSIGRSRPLYRRPLLPTTYGAVR